MNTEVSAAYFLKGQSPLDAKSVYKSGAHLKRAIRLDPELPLSFYKGMEIYLQTEGEKIIWDESVDYESEVSLLSENYIYPEHIHYEDYDYSNKEYNFFYLNGTGNLKGNYIIPGLSDTTDEQTYL